MNQHQLSKTAAYVAIKFYGLTLMKPYRDLFDEEVITFYDKLVAGLPPPLNRYHDFLKKKWFRLACMNLNETLLPGDLMHILMRKHSIPAAINRLIDNGYSQILILGAGFDHIGKTYSQRGLTCVELDVARMVQIKQQFLNEHNYANNNLTVCPVNISGHYLSNTLQDIPDLDPHARTVIAAEGFFDYLSPEEFSRTLNGLSVFFTNELKLISTVFSLQELNRFHAFVFRNSIKAVGEKLKLNATIDDFESFLKENNFQIDKKLTIYNIRGEMALPPAVELAFLPGFYLLEASKNI